MTEHNLFYYPYASFTNAQLPLLKVAALYFYKLVILDPASASWATTDAEQHTRGWHAGEGQGVLQAVTVVNVEPPDVMRRQPSANTRRKEHILWTSNYSLI